MFCFVGVLVVEKGGINKLKLRRTGVTIYLLDILMALYFISVHFNLQKQNSVHGKRLQARMMYGSEPCASDSTHAMTIPGACLLWVKSGKCKKISNFGASRWAKKLHCKANIKETTSRQTISLGKCRPLGKRCQALMLFNTGIKLSFNILGNRNRY